MESSHEGFGPIEIRLIDVFEQSLSFMALLVGPDHRFELANQAYRRLIGGRDVVGLTIREALPDIEGQGFYELLDQVYRTGQPYVGRAQRATLQPDRAAPPTEVIVDFTFQPVRDAEGEITAIFVEGYDVSDSFRAQTALRQNEALLRAIGESSGDLIYAKDLESRLLYANPALLAVIGQPLEQLLGRHEGEWHSNPAEAAAIRENDLGVIASGDVQRMDETFSTPEGRVLLYQSSKAPMRDADGAVVGIVGVSVDVTERRRVEEALNISEESHRLAVEAAGVGTWDLNLVTNVLTWSERTRAAFGLSPDAPCCMDDFYAGLHRDDLEATSRAFDSAIDPKVRATYDVEYRTIGKEDGVTRWVAAKGKGMFDGEGRCARAIGTAIDITARKQSEQALRELNETLERRVAEAILERQVWADMLEATDDPAAAVDADLKFIAMNQAYRTACERLFGVKFEIGQSLSDQLADQPDVQASSVALWSRALAGENLDYQQSGERNRDGTYYDLKFRPLTNRDGRRIGAFQFSRDVTERVQAQRRLKEAEEALRQSHKMEAVGQLTGGIAHDFNNMLAVVLGSLELLSRRIGAADPRAKRYVDAAAEAGKRAANLTQRLLAFSRQQPLQPEAVNPNKLVSGMSELLSHSLGGAVVVETVLAAGVWRIHADPNQLENVLLNLAVNARDAMLEGGKLTIETQNVHIDDRYAAAEVGVTAGQYVLFAITDTGIGMPREVIAKAFDPFFTTKEVGKGTGLGLSQVYGFIKQSGGHVRIYSEVGQGTTVKIYLPRLHGAVMQDSADLNEPNAARGEPSELILVVEDEPAVRQFSVDALNELGYRVLEADNAKTALDILLRTPEIVLLFTDVVMPEINGKRLAEEALVLRPDLKVLFTTGYTRNAVVHNGVLDQGVELIGKPFTIDALAAKVRTLLEA